MTEFSRRFNFDDFDDQVREALEQNDEAMAKLCVRGLAAVPDSLRGPDPAPTLLPDPPEAA